MVLRVSKNIIKQYIQHPLLRRAEKWEQGVYLNPRYEDTFEIYRQCILINTAALLCYVAKGVRSTIYLQQIIRTLQRRVHKGRRLFTGKRPPLPKHS